MRRGVRIAVTGGRSRLALLVLAVGLMAVPAQSDAQEISELDWIGQLVVPKHRDFRLPKGHDPVHDKMLADYTVVEVKGLSLRIKTSQGDAWIAADQVVPFEKAFEFFSDAIKANPQDAFIFLPDKALTDLNEAIRLDPKNAVCYRHPADIWAAKGDSDKAIADCTRAIRLDPKDADSYQCRSEIWGTRKDDDKAIADYDEAVRLDPQNASGYRSRGHVFLKKSDYDKALADFDQALRLDPRCMGAHAGRAWIWATARDPKYRDGRRAVEAASKASELSKEKTAYVLDAMAAAFAEIGDFEAAVKWEIRAIDRESDEESKADYASRLKLYRERKPYRETNR